MEISAGRQMAASERLSKWSQAGALADRQNSVAQELGNKNMEMFPKGMKRTPPLPPHVCQGNRAPLCQDSVR